MKCPAALNIQGDHFPCEMVAPHLGLAHASSRGEAIWTEDSQALTDAWASAEEVGW